MLRSVDRCGLRLELGRERGEVREGHAAEHLLLKILRHAIENVLGHLHILVVEVVLRIRVDTELFPVLADDLEGNVSLLDEVVLLLGEGDDTLVHVLRRGVAVLLNVTVRGDILRVVHIDRLAGLFVWHEVEQVAVAVAASGLPDTHIGVGGDVQPSLLVINLWLVLVLVEDVEGHGNGLTAVRIDSQDGHTGDNTTGRIGLSLSCREDLLRITDGHNHSVRELRSSGIALDNDAGSVRLVGRRLGKVQFGTLNGLFGLTCTFGIGIGFTVDTGHVCFDDIKFSNTI